MTTINGDLMTRLRWGDAFIIPPKITEDPNDSANDEPEETIDEPIVTFLKTQSKGTRESLFTSDSFNHASMHRDGDHYDYLGRNTSVQERRQRLEPWHLVEYKKRKSRSRLN